MYLSLQNRALVNAKINEGKVNEANAIINEWHSSTSATYPEINISQRKLKEETEQLNKVKAENQ